MKRDPGGAGKTPGADCKPVKIGRRHLMAVYDRLHRAFGPQGWWPGETPFEVSATSADLSTTRRMEILRAGFQLGRLLKTSLRTGFALFAAHRRMSSHPPGKWWG